MRALSLASFYDYGAMTLEECANDCAGYLYFGVEYGGECKLFLPSLFLMDLCDGIECVLIVDE
jgi:hypothetical protein